MAHNDVFGDSVLYDFFRQIINATIEIANADGNTSELAQIVSRLESLRDDLANDFGEHNMPANNFPGGDH